jgi:hypothetical protein
MKNSIRDKIFAFINLLFRLLIGSYCSFTILDVWITYLKPFFENLIPTNDVLGMKYALILGDATILCVGYYVSLKTDFNKKIKNVDDIIKIIFS